VSVGVLDVLSVGRGHLRLEIPDDDPDALEKARRMIEDMQRQGYSIFIEDSIGRTRRMKKFDPKRMTYLIDAPDEKSKVEVKASESRATAVGRTAGG
jgi:hypothetical protein